MRSPTRGHAQALVALTALFAARVLGQALVAFLDVPLLPPMSAWYSGLLPYPILLPTQLLILYVWPPVQAAGADGKQNAACLPLNLTRSRSQQ
ncbi:MAG: hypothetical protein DMD86_03345 [Candidatus Rokuibacteriota bacterium]|nr:MAG: hypothetical protein DMD86_03345 [Candidatus Rokubacteria bacterium]